MSDTNAIQQSQNPWHTFKYCLIIGLGAILFGLDQTASAGLIAMDQYNEDFGTYDPSTGRHIITARYQTLIFGLPLAGAVMGCLISGPIGSRYGRRIGLALCAIGSILGPVIQIVAPNIGVNALGRFVNGLGMGFAANFCIMYWAEITQARYRGMVVMMYQGFINIAQFIGAGINKGTNDLDNKWAWRGPLMVMLSAPLVLLLFLPFIPDTPRWFVSRGRIADAHKAMLKIRGPSWPAEDVAEELKNVVAMDQIERELEGTTSYRDCFHGTDLRRTRIALMTMLIQPFTGIPFITAYGTYFFLISGLSDAFLITIITSSCALAGSALAFPLVKYFGRRILLICGGAVCSASMLIFASVGAALPNSVPAARCLVAFSCCYIFTYGATWVPIPQAIIGEIPSNRLRSKTVSLATSVCWLSICFIVCGIPYLLSEQYVNLGTKLGFIFGACSGLGTVWVYLELPETKDRTLEEIDEIFLNHISARKFSSYICTGQAGDVSVEKVAAHNLGKGEVETFETV